MVLKIIIITIIPYCEISNNNNCKYLAQWVRGLELDKTLLVLQKCVLLHTLYHTTYFYCIVYNIPKIAYVYKNRV
jgi:hypothetical protein